MSIVAIVSSAWVLSAAAGASEYGAGICRNDRGLRVGRHALAGCARVAGLVAGGGYAEYGLVHEAHALEIPKNMSFSDAAALPETIYTVWANVFELAA